MPAARAASASSSPSRCSTSRSGCACAASNSAASSSAISASGRATNSAKRAVTSKVRRYPRAGILVAMPGSAAAPSSDQVHATVSSRLRAVGQRLTTNRRVLLDALTAAARPLTIPEILDEQPDLAQSSVYRNLVVLEDAGVVHRVVGTAEFARWELTEDLAGHHHHLICASC